MSFLKCQEILKKYLKLDIFFKINIKNKYKYFLMWIFRVTFVEIIIKMITETKTTKYRGMVIEYTKRTINYTIFMQSLAIIIHIVAILLTILSF